MAGTRYPRFQYGTRTCLLSNGQYQDLTETCLLSNGRYRNLNKTLSQAPVLTKTHRDRVPSRNIRLMSLPKSDGRGEVWPR